MDVCIADRITIAQVQLYGQQHGGGRTASYMHAPIGHRSRVMGNNQLFPPSAIRWNLFSALTKAALFENGSLDASEFNRASSIASGGDGISVSASLSTMISSAAVAGAVDELLCRCFGTSVNKLSGQIS